MKNNYGLQLYSVRDSAKENFAGTLKRVAELGYKYVEPAGFYGHSAEEVKSILDENGLILTGTHSSFEDLRPSKIMETIAYHKIIGNPNYIVPGADLSTLEKIEDFCNVMNFAQPILKAEGINLAFHNHSREFEVKPWGSTIHAELERRTNIDFEIDTFWAFNAGVDPLAILERLKNRIKCIHLKDGFAGGKGRSLGQGDAPVRAVVEKAKELGFIMIVESEGLEPDGLSEVGRCMDFLKSIEE